MEHAATETAPVQPDDRVLDPLNRQWRTVARLDGSTVYMTDGGCMGLDECLTAEIRLASESLEDPADILGVAPDALNSPAAPVCMESSVLRDRRDAAQAGAQACRDAMDDAAGRRHRESLRLCAEFLETLARVAGRELHSRRAERYQ